MSLLSNCHKQIFNMVFIDSLQLFTTIVLLFHINQFPLKKIKLLFRCRVSRLLASHEVHILTLSVLSIVVKVLVLLTSALLARTVLLTRASFAPCDSEKEHSLMSNMPPTEIGFPVAT